MEKIEDKELYKVEGGSTSVGVVAIIVSAITATIAFLSGMVEGYTNPERCN